jgi:zinc protease
MTTNHTFDYPNSRNIVRTVLDNGVTVLIYENHNVESVNIVGSLDAGSVFEHPEQNGLASMTASALMLGTVRRDFDALHTELESVGADLDINGGTHKVSFNGKSLAEDLPLLMDILADTLRYPSFPESQVERLRGERLTGLRYREQDTQWQARRAFRMALYPSIHPYHHGSSGTLETIPILTLQHIQDFHRIHYGPRGMILVIVGAIKADDALATVNACFGDWSNPDQPQPPQLPDVAPPTQTTRRIIAVPGKSQSDIMIGTLGPSRFAPDFRPATLANSVLGQFGMMGRVGEVVREREGMAYYAGSSLEGGLGPGAWLIAAGVDPANIERAIELSINEIRRRVSQPISADELADNQSYFTGSLPLQLESSGGIAATLHSIETYNLGLDYLLTYHDQFYAVTVEAVL